MANNNLNPKDSLDTSVRIIFLDLLAEWRTIVTFVALGISIAAFFFFTTSPRYSVGFVAQVGKARAQPLESTFLAAQIIMLKHAGADDEKIETFINELDFDDIKRRTLGVKVTSNSAENTINLADKIVESLNDHHLALLDKAKEFDDFKSLPLRIKEERELVQYYKDALAKLNASDDIRHSNKTRSKIADEYGEWLRTVIRIHQNKLDQYSNEYETGYTPTFFPLRPNVKNVIETKPNINIFISGILGGCFFGALAAFARQTLNTARKDSALKNKVL